MQKPLKKPAPPKRSPGRAAARWTLVVLIGLGSALIIDLARQALTAEKVQWASLTSQDVQSSHIAVVSETHSPTAQGENAPRPRLIRFTADWCPPCLSMKSQVFSRDDVAEAIHARFDAFSVDLTRPDADEQLMSDQFRVVYLPTFVVIDDQGHEIARLDDPADAEGFLHWLEQGWDQWARHTAEAHPPAYPMGSPPAHANSIN
ncbi:MAG: thioredoxin family protein [Planctomycetota bacterium]